MTEWRKVKLEDVCDLIAGFAFKSNDFGEYSDKVIKITNIEPPFVNMDNLTGVDLSLYNKIKLEKFIAKKGDYVLAMTGATIGKLGRIHKNEAYINQRVLMFKPKSEADKRFLYYVLSDHNFQRYIINYIDSESAQANISASTLGRYTFPFPPLEIQRKIAGILGALDDKIEVLRAQNKTLEQMAQAVFRSWFVDFDIVRAKAAGLPAADVCKKYHITPDIYDLFPSAFSADNLPLGWEKKKLEDMGMIVGGGTPSTENKEFFVSAGSSIPWITPKDLSGYTGKFISYGSTDISEKGLKESSAKLMPKGTVLFSSRAPIGYCVIAENDISTNQGFKSIVPNNSGYTEYLYQFLKNNIDMISGYATGSTFKEVSGSTMKQIPILKPADDILMEFEKMIYPLNQKNKENSEQIRTLEQTRDTLLPQLISGKLDVENVSLPAVNVEDILKI